MFYIERSLLDHSFFHQFEGDKRFDYKIIKKYFNYIHRYLLSDSKLKIKNITFLHPYNLIRQVPIEHKEKIILKNLNNILMRNRKFEVQGIKNSLSYMIMLIYRFYSSDYLDKYLEMINNLSLDFNIKFQYEKYFIL